VSPDIDVRPMRQSDLGAVLEVADVAFRGLVERTSGRRPEGPMFASTLGPYRLQRDPAGCHVALFGDEVVGANFSVARGALGWFGPLAVRPELQGRGIAQRLVAECMASMDRRSVRLIGLETLAGSSQHIHLYQKMGFRPSWTGIAYTGDVHDVAMPDSVEADGPVPSLDFVLGGYDPSSEILATRSSRVGVALTSADGLAICHLENTLWVDPTLAYVPLVAARDRDRFDRLMQAVEAVARQHGKSRVATQVPGSAWATQEALVERGYRPGGASLRMKRGERTDYDAGDFFYCEDWH
jgi:GNAT superfamily N-acetyltransferase